MTHTVMSNALECSIVVAVKEQISSDLAGEAVILNLKSGVYFGLNEVGARIWGLIQHPMPVQDLRDALLTEYDVEPEVCDRDPEYEVDGFECNPQLVEFANKLFQKEALPLKIQCISRDSCPEVKKLYDGVIVGWGAYMLIQGRRRRVEFLKQLRATVDSNSPILLSFFCTSRKGRYFKLVAMIGNIFRQIFGRERLDVGDLPLLTLFITSLKRRLRSNCKKQDLSWKPIAQMAMGTRSESATKYKK